MTKIDITEIFGDVVGKLAENGKLKILYPDGKGGTKVVDTLKVNYIFGSSRYIKDELDKYSKSASGTERKLPLIALFAPVNEDRSSRTHFMKSRVSLIIACSSRKDWSNEERKVMSFKNILRPIYDRFMEVLLDDERFDWGYEDIIKHSYSENYSYGKYGAYTDSGESVSEPIDAINIRLMEIKINNPNCEEK